MRSSISLLLLISVVAFIAGNTLSDFPGLPGEDPWDLRPNDPKYDEQWQFYSHIPKDHEGEVSAWEMEHGSGISLDKAWQLHLGDPQTVVAVLDSGIHWDEKDLLGRYILNEKELPLPHGSDMHDVNGDGRVAIDDYSGDPRLSDDNGNGVIDPGDFIAIFSDGVDDDANGFVDDIAGWDFHEHDNDPYDRTRFGHGTGEAKDSVATTNNGVKGVGGCGSCSLLMLRLDDSFVVDAHAFARAVVYATDRGAAVVQQALGSVNNSDVVQKAVDYAYDRGTIIVGSAADETSFHHNFPSTLDPVLYPNAIRYDSREPEGASTFLNFNNCSNFGARVDVSVSALSCSSEATGMLSGTVALAHSFSKAMGKALTPLEMTALVRMSADDINRGSNANEPTRHSSYEGWDIISGYGRANAFTMLKRIKERKLPPAARIHSPEWFSVIRSDEAEIPVSVSLPRARDGLVSYELRVARGVETSKAVWKDVARGEGDLSQEVVAKLSVSELMSMRVASEEAGRNQNAFTLELTARSRSGVDNVVRRTFFLSSDPSLRAGFPVGMSGSGESGGVFYDLDGDGSEEYITADGAGAVHAFDAQGVEVEGFPFRGVSSAYASAVLPARSSVFAPIAVGDLEGDGRVEIVVATIEADLFVLDSRGNMKAGFPVKLPRVDYSIVSKAQVLSDGVLGSPVLADLDRDGRDDILVPGLDGRLHAYDGRGQVLSGYPIAVEAGGKLAKIVSSPAVGDLNGDGYVDIIVGSNHISEEAGYLFAYDARAGTIADPSLAGFPRRIPILRDAILPTVGTGVPMNPVLHDFDRDGELEILIHGFVGKPYLVGADGRLESSLSMRLGQGSNVADDLHVAAFGHPAVAKREGSFIPVGIGVGRRMLLSLLSGGKRVPFDHVVSAWDPLTGEALDGMPQVSDDMALAVNPLAVDLDGDGRDEIISTSGGYFVRAWHQDGTPVAGFPKFTGGWAIGGLSLGDIDGDNKWDLAVSTREGHVFIWDLSIERQGRGTWTTNKGSAKRLGRVEL